MTGRGTVVPADDPQVPSLSVIIPTRDRRALVEAALAALSQQTLPANQFEVIIVVDGSTDGTLEAVEGLVAPFRLRVIWRGGGGRAAACNAGIAAATADVVALLDDDVQASPGLLEAHLRANQSAQRRAVMGPVPVRNVEDAPLVTRHLGAKFDRHKAALEAGRLIGFRDVYTGNFSIRQEILHEAGCFDQGFAVYGNEDGELGVRLLAAGGEMVYEPIAIAHQTYDKSLAELARDNVAKGRTAVILAGKHPHAASGLRLAAPPSRKTRGARAVLLWLTRRWNGTPHAITRTLDALGQQLPGLALRLYGPVLDYFYWLGATSEMRGQRKASILSRAGQGE